MCVEQIDVHAPHLRALVGSGNAGCGVGRLLLDDAETQPLGMYWLRSALRKVNLSSGSQYEAMLEERVGAWRVLSRSSWLQGAHGPFRRAARADFAVAKREAMRCFDRAMAHRPATRWRAMFGGWRH
jgi:hypothetical protein